MDTSSTVITPATARHVLWHFGEGGHPAGSFTERLLDLICRADPTHAARLALGFPGEVAAVHLAQNNPTGIEQLQAIAQGQVAA